MVVVVKAANTKVRARLTIVKRYNRCPVVFPGPWPTRSAERSGYDITNGNGIEVPKVDSRSSNC